MKYKAKHGHCNVPTRQGSLGKWVNNQRSAYTKGKLSVERVRKLDDIGFGWDGRVANLNFERLPTRESRGEEDGGRKRKRRADDDDDDDSAPARSTARSAGSSDTFEEADPSQESELVPAAAENEAAEEMEIEAAAAEPVRDGPAADDDPSAASDGEEQTGPDVRTSSSDVRMGSSGDVVLDNCGGASESPTTGDEGEAGGRNAAGEKAESEDTAATGTAASAATEHATSKKADHGAAVSRPSNEVGAAENAGRMAVPLELRPPASPRVGLGGNNSASDGYR